MDAAAIAEGQETDGLARQAQRDLRGLPVPADCRGDRKDQSDSMKYFAIGHSSRCFSYIRYWVERKIRRHLTRACQRQGFGWKRWSREWLYGTLGCNGSRSSPASFSRYSPVRSSDSSLSV